MALLTLPLGLTPVLMLDQLHMQKGVLHTVVDAVFDRVPVLRKYIQIPSGDKQRERNNM
jgi:hypothetical protein